MKKNIDEIASDIGNLNDSELDKLTEILLNEHDVVATIYNTCNEATDVDNHYGVRLIEGGRNKLRLVKMLKEGFNIGLKEAKNIVDSAPITLQENMSKDEAEKFVKVFKEECDYSVNIRVIKHE